MVDAGQGGHQREERLEEGYQRSHTVRNDLIEEMNPLPIDYIQDTPPGEEMVGEITRASHAAALAMASAQNAIYGSSGGSAIASNHLLSGTPRLLSDEGDGLENGVDGVEGHGGNVFVDITEIYSMVAGNNNNNNNQNVNTFPYELSPHRTDEGGEETELGGDGSAASSPYSLSRPNRQHPHHPHHPHQDESFSSVNPLHRRQHPVIDGKPITIITTPLSQQKSTVKVPSSRSQYREPVYQGKRRAIGSNGNLASSFLMSTHDRYVFI